MLKITFLVVAIILMASGIFAPSDADLLQFQDMVVCATPEGHLSALVKYNGYGCYCGLGGDGDPVDETDKCCQAHDACYEGAKSCFLHEKYTATYHYNKWRNAGWDPKTCQITCRPASGYAIWEFNEDCKAWQCECDRQGALCFGRESSTLNVAKYGSYPQSFCK